MNQKTELDVPLTEKEKVKAELNEIDLLTQKGVTFEVDRKSFWSRFSKKKTREFTIFPSYLGTMDLLAAEFVQMRFDQIAIEEDWYFEIKRMVASDVKRCAKIVAIAYINKEDMSEVDHYANYFLWRLTPATLLKISQIIYQQSNLKDFFGSIVLMSIKERTTAPIPVETEKNKKVEQQD